MIPSSPIVGLNLGYSRSPILKIHTSLNSNTIPYASPCEILTLLFFPTLEHEEGKHLVKWIVTQLEELEEGLLKNLKKGHLEVNIVIKKMIDTS